MAREALEYTLLYLLFMSLALRCLGQQDTVKEVIEKDNRFLSIFKAYLKNVQILDDLGKDDHWYTVFAPVDDAFEDLKGNIDTMPYNKRLELMSYHMVFHVEPNRRLELRNNQWSPSHAINQPRLWFSVYGDRKAVNGARVTAQSDANNGRVYYINKVLYPVGTKDNTWAYIRSNFNIAKSFYDLIVAGDMDAQFNQMWGTLLIPNNMALSTGGGLDTTVRNELVKDKPKLQKVIRGHIMDKEIWPLDRLEYVSNIEVDVPRFDGVKTQNAAQTLDPDCKCTLAKRGDDRYIMCGMVSAKILEANIMTNSGIVHIIDKLVNFVHSNAQEQIARDGDLSDYLASLKQETDEELLNYLNQENGPQVTVVAPVNNAYGLLKQETLDRLRTDQPFLKKVLNLHVIPNEMVVVRNIPIGGEVAFAKESRAPQDPNKPDGKKMMLRFYRDENDTYVEGGHTVAKILRMDVGVTTGVIHYIDRVLGAPYLTIQEAILKQPNLTDFQVYLHQVNMWTLLGVTDQKFTLFAPTNEVLWKIRRADPELFRTPWALKYVMRRHFLNQTVFFFDEIGDGAEIQLMANNTNKLVLQNQGGYQYRIKYSAHSIIYTAAVIKGDIGCMNGALHIINDWLYVPGSEGDIIGGATGIRPSCINAFLVLLTLLCHRWTVWL